MQALLGPTADRVCCVLSCPELRDHSVFAYFIGTCFDALVGGVYNVKGCYVLCTRVLGTRMGNIFDIHHTRSHSPDDT